MPEIASKDWVTNETDLILITGANGFIGSKVFETLLEYGFTRIRCFLRSNRNLTQLKRLADRWDADVDFCPGNLLSRADCARAAEGASVVYHLAAGVEKTFPGCFLNSAVAVRNLLDSLIKNQTLKRFVNISSLAVYFNGRIPRGGLLDETCEVDTALVERFEPYTYGKAKQDEIVLDYAQKQDLPYVIVRPGVVFGPGKGKITGRIGKDTFGVFLHLGGNNIIPFTHVDNCAEAIVLAGLRKGVDGEVFNIVDDDLPTSREFLQMYKERVCRFFSIPVPYPAWLFFNCLWEKYSKYSEGQFPPVFNRRSCIVYWKGNTYSNRKAKDLLNWQPRIAMKDALEGFFDYMRERS